MDYYGLLKVPSNAKQVDIDRAYQKLIRDARYDNTVNRKDIEIAYKILSDATQRALYDATTAEKNKAQLSSKKVKRRKATKEEKQRNMVVALVVLLLLACIYYPLRFGYHFKKFEAGDAIYYKDTNNYFGKISKIDKGHSFGVVRKDAYLITLDSDSEIWFPATDIKMLCYKK